MSSENNEPYYQQYTKYPEIKKYSNKHKISIGV